MRYQWNQVKTELPPQNINNNNQQNCINNLSQHIDEDINSEQEKSLSPLESELNVFDPLDFLGLEKNSDEDNNNELHLKINENTNFSKKDIKKLLGKKRLLKKKCFIKNKHNINNDNISEDKKCDSFENIESKPKSNNKLRTGYSEVFSQHQSDNNIITRNNSNSIGISNSLNINQISSKITNSYTNTNNVIKKKKIPFVNNVNEDECEQLKNQYNSIITKKSKEDIKKDIYPSNQIKEQEITPRKVIDYSTFNTKIISPNKKNISFNSGNKNSLLFFQNQQSNLNNSNIFQYDYNNTKYNLDFPSNSMNNQQNDIFNYNPQNSNLNNSIFDIGNNSNFEFFKNNSSNIFRNDYYGNKNMFSNIFKNEDLSKNNEDKNDSKFYIRNEIDDSNIHTPLKNKTKKKKSLNKNKNKSTNKKTYKKISDDISDTNISANKNSSPVFFNQNNYFANFAGQFYQQIPIQVDIPHPSIFLEDTSVFSHK